MWGQGDVIAAACPALKKIGSRKQEAGLGWYADLNLGNLRPFIYLRDRQCAVTLLYKHHRGVTP